MLRTPIGHCRLKWLAGRVCPLSSKLPKCYTSLDAGHEFPDSGLSRSEPPIIVVMGKQWRSWPGRCSVLLAVLACMVMAGCAGVSSGQKSGGSGSNPDPPPAGPGLLSVAPTTMSFGTVAVGKSTNLTGTLTAGSSDINVTSAAWTGQGYNVSGITFPVTVAAGKSITYTVTFAPQAAGDSAGSISFVSDGSDSPLAQTLDGSGGQAGVHTVGLAWSPSTSPVIGYNVYRGTESGGPYQLLTSSPQPDTSYTDGTVLTGTTYFYVATAVDSNHVESTYSNQAQAAIP
jgi:hypothetical protein